MTREEPIAAARQIVEDRFPKSRAAFLASGVLTSLRTSTSDLDIVVVLDGPPAPYRETIRSRGWIVEIFVHSRESLDLFYELDADSRSCTLATICAEGVILKDEDGDASSLQASAKVVIAQGPKALTEDEREQLRYMLTDLLDDLRGSSNLVETVFIGARLLNETGNLALVDNRHWTGSGKWLARQLARASGDLDVRLAEALTSLITDGDKNPLTEVVTEVLEKAGGLLTEGFRAEKTTQGSD